MSRKEEHRIVVCPHCRMEVSVSRRIGSGSTRSETLCPNCGNLLFHPPYPCGVGGVMGLRIVGMDGPLGDGMGDGGGP